MDYVEESGVNYHHGDQGRKKNGLLMLGGLQPFRGIALAAARLYQLSLAVAAASALYLMAYPTYSVRGYVE